MSHDLVVEVDVPRLTLTLWQLEPSESRITEKENEIRHMAAYLFLYNVILLCWPVFVPQMTGDPQAPGEVMENWSVEQSPVPPSKKRQRK